MAGTSLKTKKEKTCKVCAVKYTAWTDQARINRFCSPHCAAKWGHEKATELRLKAMRKERREAKEKSKTRSDWQREAQAAFNKYIRARDSGKPCISCGVFEQGRHGGSHFDCGHYRSTGAAPHMRYFTYNAAGQCVRCNRDLSGNAVEMRKGMVLRFGLDRVEQVEADDTARKYTIDDLKRIKRIFNKRARHVARLRGG